MIISIEISMYALKDDYKTPIQAFIDRLAKHSHLDITYSAMSTSIVGEFEDIMPILNNEIHASLLKLPESVFIIKLSGGCH
ncbi:MAG: hypothetical protein U9N57_05740 [Pseudomonadota bacterium]|nr:hypothetical protein [Pseudomonadota bacterium]